MQNVASPRRPRRIRERPGLVLPLLLLAAGLTGVLVQFGYLSTAATDRLTGLWPVLLILVGIELIVTRLLPGTLGIAAALLAMTAVVVASLGYAFSGPAPGVTSYTGGAAAGTATSGSLTLNVAGTTVTLAGADLGDQLYAVTAGSAGGRPSFAATGGQVTVSMSGSGLRVPWAGSTRGSVAVSLNRSLPWDLTLNGAAVTGTLDASGFEVTSIRAATAGSDLTLRLSGSPRAWVPIRASGAGARLVVEVPAGTPVRASVQALGGSLTVAGTGQAGSSWTSPEAAGSVTGYDIQATGLGSALTVEVQR